MGRAARHVEGRVILYADKTTSSMQRALDEVERRRLYQIEFNKKHGIIPRSIDKPIREKVIEKEETEEMLTNTAFMNYKRLGDLEVDDLTPMDKKKLKRNLRKEMLLAANDLNFELAAEIRDKIREIEE